eukprot:6076852-Pleurochrysis_carterae.AAC.1
MHDLRRLRLYLAEFAESDFTEHTLYASGHACAFGRSVRARLRLRVSPQVRVGPRGQGSWCSSL